MHISIETISPADAKELLAANVNNRHLRESTIREYAAAMERGEWLESGEPIIFDIHGDLINDTNRMRKLLGQVDGRRLSYKPLSGE